MECKASLSSSTCKVLGQVACYGFMSFTVRLKSITFVLPTGIWPEGSKFSGRVAPFNPQDRLSGTEFLQYKTIIIMIRKVDH
jgi:hypothetical protein